jgi:hypothetical protein
MKRTELLQEVRKMRFEEAYEGWQRAGCSYRSVNSIPLSSTHLGSLPMDITLSIYGYHFRKIFERHFRRMEKENWVQT